MSKHFSSAVFMVHELYTLLVFHKRYQLWLPIGGELEADETPLEAAIRETREETGIELSVGDFIPSTMPGEPPGFVGYEEHSTGDKGTHLNFNFVAAPLNWVSTPEVHLSDEHAAFEWFQLIDVITSSRIETSCNVRALAARILRRWLDIGMNRETLTAERRTLT